MKWLGGRESDNVEYSGRGGGGKLLGGGIGAGIIGLIIYLVTGYTPDQVNRMAGSSANNAPIETNKHFESGSAGNFASIVLAETEVIWDSLFTANGMTYTKPRLNIFEDEVNSACGGASAAVGPFYCPSDQKIYLDVSFFNELKDRFGAPGDFANAYVIAHEVGHHIQYLMGTTQKMSRLRGNGDRSGPHSTSVMLELQADFYAGVWAHYAEKMNSKDNPVVIEPGDIQAALNAANAVGDDRLQKQTQGRVVPDAFTHGTSKQRMYWFKKGYETGDMSQGDTFRELAN
ncbi:metalloprotease [Flavipsychrobacter stenotrophus]|uniref:Metalloprotease n=1 Tax=Flavipsychrobacter stenotrophus TaxID=2077091 RepID=A0A2S7SQK4_9BACT|nr:neutral zinc metallopeptidase [Flavipsychrobacter stenotrophus]PQJ09189.1 metalloprotease [Flavipsychrobacter stenotrophus]